MKFMFSCCYSLSYIPNISKFCPSLEDNVSNCYNLLVFNEINEESSDNSFTTDE